MEHVTTLIIGAGHAGLALSRALTHRSVEHVLLERGGPGHAWRSERWDSLRMLTPNWANGLPGAAYDGPEPDGFMTATEFADRLERYARAIAAPIRRGVTVTRVTRKDAGFRVETDHGIWAAETVVNATGATRLPRIPALARDLPSDIEQLTPHNYRNSEQLPEGDVLVVGASASGVQLAREIQLAGRHVTLAVGAHVRLPRRYRGRDIEFWLHRSGIYDERASEVEDLAKARRLPSAQLFGGGPVDLNALQLLGVEITGRLAAIREGKALFSGGLHNVVTAADLKMHRTLDRIDDWLEGHAETSGLATMRRPGPTAIPDQPRLSLDLRRGTVKAIIWATGYAADHSWMDLPVFDARGRLQHDGGVCPLPGLFVTGLPLLRRRRSHHISGAAADAQDLSYLITQHLDARRAA
ncbi:MAG: NAD(P)-binding domain-containing protein [Pseudomonadota bacterium]